MFIDTIKAEFNSSWYAVNFLLVRKTYWNVLSFKCLELIQWKNSSNLWLEWAEDGCWVGGTFRAVYSKMFYAFMCAYTRVFNVTLAITVLVAAVSQHESRPWWSQGKLCHQIQQSRVWLLDKCSKIFLLLRGCGWAGAEAVGPGCGVVLYGVSLGLCSCSYAAGTEDCSKRRLKEKKKWFCSCSSTPV